MNFSKQVLNSITIQNNTFLPSRYRIAEEGDGRLTPRCQRQVENAPLATFILTPPRPLFYLGFLMKWLIVKDSKSRIISGLMDLRRHLAAKPL